MSDKQVLINKLYEAAFIPELWPAVCDDLARFADAYSCSIINLRPGGQVSFVTSPHLHDDMVRFAESGVRSPLPDRQLAQMPFSFQRDIDLLDAEEIEKDPLKNLILAPLGLRWQMGDAIMEPSGHVMVFDFLRKAEDGPFTVEHCNTLNALRPDLARAVLMASRAAFMQAVSTTNALAIIGMPAAVLGDNGNVLSANSAFEALSPAISVGSGDRVRMQNSKVQALYDLTLKQLEDDHKTETQSIPIARSRDRAAMILHLVPIRRQARDVFARGSTVLLATHVGEVGPPDTRVLCGLFDLTPAEARVAREIAVGAAPEAVAETLGLATHTVRTHMKRIFTKTATTRQAELVALLANLVVR